MRIGKILIAVIGGLLGLLVLGLLAVWLLVNPNDYKPRIEAAVKNATGRDLNLEGAIHLSVFPWIALELGPATLGNPPGFPAEPFLSLNQASVRVKLLPLLGKRLEVGRLDLEGLDVKLYKNPAGQGNWQGFGSNAPAPEAVPAGKPAPAGEMLEGIAGIKISNARISYQKLSVQNINLETGSFSPHGHVPITLHLEADQGAADEKATLDLRFDFSADSSAERFALAALHLDSTVTRSGYNRPLTLSVTAPAVDLDLNAQTLAMPSFAVNLDGADVSGSLSGTRVVDAPTIAGTVTLAPVVLRDYLARLGLPVPATRDPKALSSLAFSSRFDYGDNAARLMDMNATLDDTHLKGSAGIVNLTTEAMAFDLAVDHIDLDRYLPPPSKTAPAAGAPAPESTKKGPPLQANGTFTVGAVHMAPLDLTDVKLMLSARDNVLHLHPLTAEIDGGQYSGDVTLDERGAAPAISLDEHLTGIDVGKLMASETQKLHVSGKGNVNLKATGHGAGADGIMKTLDGSFDTNIADGAVEGMDLGYQLGRAESLLHQQAPAGQDTKRTKFDAFKMSAHIADGIATTRDLLISSAVLKITGQGSANLPAQTLDFELVADTGKTAGNLKIPVKVTGSLSDPTIRPDVEALAKGALKDKVQDALKDKLKGLLVKP
jgi:AsmA protein